MKELKGITFDPVKCRAEIAAFRRLLGGRSRLAERADIQAFFKKNEQFSAFLGTYSPTIGPAPLLAFEFELVGDFAADVVVGHRGNGSFILIELEDGRPDSVFRKAPRKTTTEWSARYEHGFSQLVDWFYALDDFKKTERFARDFGRGHVTFQALLILGRSAGVSDHDRVRLRWRAEKVRIDSHTVECVTLDDLCAQMEWRIGHFPERAGAAK